MDKELACIQASCHLGKASPYPGAGQHLLDSRLGGVLVVSPWNTTDMLHGLNRNFVLNIACI